MYESLITYPVYDLNSSEFVELIKEILEAEFSEQRTTHNKTFLPTEVKTDEYLLSPIADKEINPAFCSVIKAKMNSTDYRYSVQQNDLNNYIIGILANGLENLRKIGDAIYEILNDMDVKNYIFTYKNALGNNVISDSGEFYISSLSTEFEVSKTMNDKNIVYGSLVLNAQIAEIPKENTHPSLTEMSVDHKLGDNEIKLTQTTI
jgi:hypothetical protein